MGGSSVRLISKVLNTKFLITEKYFRFNQIEKKYQSAMIALKFIRFLK
jgi:hypothetical protein